VTAVSEAEIRTGLGLLPDGRRRRELTVAADRVLDEAFSGSALEIIATISPRRLLVDDAALAAFGDLEIAVVAVIGAETAELLRG